jgi:hypothetical protein
VVTRAFKRMAAGTGVVGGQLRNRMRATWVDMIVAVPRRYPRRSFPGLIAVLNKEFRWKTTESAVTGYLYTRRDRFVHSARSF